MSELKLDADNLCDMIEIIHQGMAKKITNDNITVYKVGDIIRIDIKEEK